MTACDFQLQPGSKSCALRGCESAAVFFMGFRVALWKMNSCQEMVLSVCEDSIMVSDHQA